MADNKKLATLHGPPGKQRRTKVGRVVSIKMQKTVVVAVERLVRHPLYGRTMRQTNRFKAHDEENRCQVGDTVEIAETRPISKEKHWIVQSILRRGTGEPVELEEVPTQ